MRPDDASAGRDLLVGLAHVPAAVVLWGAAVESTDPLSAGFFIVAATVVSVLGLARLGSWLAMRDDLVDVVDVDVEDVVDALPARSLAPPEAEEFGVDVRADVIHCVEIESGISIIFCWWDDDPTGVGAVAIFVDGWALRPLLRGDEDAFFDAIQAIARRYGAESDPREGEMLEYDAGDGTIIDREETRRD